MSDYEIMVLCALRYALGRKSYITGLVSDYIWDNRKILGRRAREQVVEDIKGTKDLGMEMDKLIWEGLVERLERYDG